MRAVIEAAGFTAVEFSARRWHAFDGAPFESSAAEFGTEGAAIIAIKPVEALPAADVVLEAQGLAPRLVETSDGGGVRRWRC